MAKVLLYKILESKDVNIYHINVYIYVKEYGEKRLECDT